MQFDVYFLQADDEAKDVKQMDVVASSPEDALAQFRAFQHWMDKHHNTKVRFVLLERVYGPRTTDGVEHSSLTDLLADERIEPTPDDRLKLGERVWLLTDIEGDQMLRDPRTGKCFPLQRTMRRHSHYVRVLGAGDGAILGFVFATSEANANARARNLRRFVTKERLTPVRTVVVARPRARVQPETEEAVHA